jgi:multiple antibiotic resistance protein
MFDIPIIIQLFVLLDPLASFPFLISAYHKQMNLKMIALKAVLTAFAIAVVMMLIGPSLFDLFGISLNSFRIAGGFVLFVLGYHMIRPPKEEATEITNIDALTTIIATPMLTGPATISFITIKTLEIGNISILSDIIGAFILVGGVFYFFTLIVAKVHEKIIDILSRIMGLFVMAIAVEMIITGLKSFI